MSSNQNIPPTIVSFSTGCSYLQFHALQGYVIIKTWVGFLDSQFTTWFLTWIDSLWVEIGIHFFLYKDV